MDVVLTESDSESDARSTTRSERSVRRTRLSLKYTNTSTNINTTCNTNDISNNISTDMEPSKERQTLGQCMAKKRKVISPTSLQTKVRDVNDPQPGTSGVPLTNRFEVLSDEDSDVEEVEEKIKRPPPPPPLIIKGKVADHTLFTNRIKSYVKKGFYIKYTLNNTNLYIKDPQERLNLITIINDENLQYYTYSDKNEKTHAFVIRGLDSEPDVDDIREELEEVYKIKIKNVYKMRTKNRPLYMVITTTETKLKELETKIKYLQYTRVEWERHHNKKVIIQCHRCQQWGHATSNCRVNPACVKCGMNHWTKDCTKPRDTDASCVNCKGCHTANNIECPVYLRKLEERNRLLDERQQQRQQRQRPAASPAPRFVPAPAPTRNVWAEREAARRAQPTTSTAPEHMPPGPSAVCPTPSVVRAAPATARQPLLPLPSMCASAVPPCAPAPPTRTDASNGAAQIDELFKEMKTLNSLINLNNMIIALRDLNSLLTNCKNKTDKFTTFLTFTQNIDTYDI